MEKLKTNGLHIFYELDWGIIMDLSLYESGRIQSTSRYNHSYHLSNGNKIKNLLRVGV